MVCAQCYNLCMQDSLHTSPDSSPNGMSAGRRYDLITDPIFYGTLGFFALLTTLLPAALGQPNLLPILQTLALTIFLAIPLRRGMVDKGIAVLTVWLALQLLVMTVGSALLPQLFERAIHDGFEYHRAILEWSVTGQGLPGWLLVNPLSRFGEMAGVLLGSLFSAGLAGLWFLMRAVNQFGYVAGRLAAGGSGGLLLGLMPWRLVTIAGYSGSVLLLAQPLLTNNWNFVYYFTRQRRLVTASAILISLGLLLELTLAGLWQSLSGL